MITPTEVLLFIVLVGAAVVVEMIQFARGKTSGKVAAGTIVFVAVVCALFAIFF